MSTSYTVILPALNEADAIAATVDRLTSLLPGVELIVVDDGSTDGTGDIAASRGATVVRHPAQGGYGRSVKDGVHAASSEVIVIADADGTYPLERIPDLVACLSRGYDMVVGARTGPHYRESLFKMPARVLLKWLVEFTAGRNIPDVNSGLRAFRRCDVLAYEDDLCNGFSFTTTITLIMMLTGKFVTYVPIDYHRRVGRSKVRIVRDTLRTLQYVTEVIATYNPLKLFLLPTTFLGGLSVASFLVAVINRDPVALLLAGIFCTGAILMFGTGIIAFIRVRSARRASR